MTDGSPPLKDCEPTRATASVVQSDAASLSSSVRAAVPRTILIALIFMATGVFSCLVHWLVLRTSMGTSHGYLHWCSVILVICGCAIAFLNRSQRLAPPLIAFGLLLLAICLSVRTADPMRANPGLILNVASRATVTPDEALGLAIPDATVELAGLSADWNGTLTSDWWRPNGVTVKKRTWSIPIEYLPHFKEGYSRRLVVRIHGAGTPARLLAFDFDGEPGACSEHSVITADGSADEWLVLSRIFGGNQTTTALRMLIGSGDFHGPDNPSRMSDPRTGAKGDFGDIQFTARIIEHADRDAIQLDCHGAVGSPPYEFRVRLIDRDGRSQIAGRVDRPDLNIAAESSPDRTYLFEVPDGWQAAKVAVERRPAYWVEFREVSLLARHYTSAQAVLVRSPPIAD